MSEEIEKQLLELVGIANGTRAGQITHKIEEIKLMLETTRREAVEEFAKSLVEGSDSSMWLEIKVKDIIEYVADFNSKEKPQ